MENKKIRVPLPVADQIALIFLNQWICKGTLIFLNQWIFLIFLNQLIENKKIRVPSPEFSIFLTSGMGV